MKTIDEIIKSLLNNINNNNNSDEICNDLMVSEITEFLNLSKDLEIRKQVSKCSEFLNQLMKFIITNNILIQDNEKVYKFNLLSIRLLRNLCANVIENQNTIISNDSFINFIIKQLIELPSSTKELNQVEFNRTKNILVALQQLLINSIVLNEFTQSLLWNQYNLYPTKLSLLINSTKDNDKFKLLPTNLMFIYNLILNSKERLNNLSTSTTTTAATESEALDKIEFIRLLLDLIKDEDLSTVTEEEEEYHDQLFNWIHLIFKLIFKNGDQFIELYKMLSTSEEITEVVPNDSFESLKGGSDGTVSSTTDFLNENSEIQKTKVRKYFKDGKTNQYQVKLLNLLDSTINDNDQKNIKEYIESNSIININICFFMLDELSTLYNIDFSRKNVSSGENQTTALNQYDFDAVFFFIKIFANITTYSGEMEELQIKKFKTNLKQDELDPVSRVLSDDSKDSNSTDKFDLNTLLRKKGLVGICIGSLHGNYDSSGGSNSTTSEDNNNNNIKTKGFNKTCESEDKGFKKEIIRILGNLAHKNYNNQNEIRELGGIELILNHCRFDVKNPYIKEWSIFAIRNLCDNNTENQNAINNLKMQGISNQEELKNLGIEVSAENGAVKFKTVPRPNKSD